MPLDSSRCPSASCVRAAPAALLAQRNRRRVPPGVLPPPVQNADRAPKAKCSRCRRRSNANPVPRVRSPVTRACASTGTCAPPTLRCMYCPVSCFLMCQPCAHMRPQALFKPSRALSTARGARRATVPGVLPSLAHFVKRASTCLTLAPPLPSATPAMRFPGSAAMATRRWRRSTSCTATGDTQRQRLRHSGASSAEAGARVWVGCTQATKGMAIA